MCIRTGHECEYDRREGERASHSIRRRLAELEQENNKQVELLRSIKQRPENEAYDICRRIRESSDPLLLAILPTEPEGVIRKTSLGSASKIEDEAWVFDQ